MHQQSTVLVASSHIPSMNALRTASDGTGVVIRWYR